MKDPDWSEQGRGNRPEAYVQFLVHFQASRDFFECHELLEEHWKDHPDSLYRSQWLGLIQLAVSRYHERRGNYRGALMMLRSAGNHLDAKQLQILGLDGEQLLAAVLAHINILQDEPMQAAYRDWNLMIIDEQLAHECRERAAAWGLTWEAASNMEDEALIHRHSRRDRSMVIAERQRNLTQRRTKKQMGMNDTNKDEEENKMTQPWKKTMEQFRALTEKIGAYEEALGVLYWDLRTGAPRKGMEVRSNAIGVLSTESFRLATGEQMKACLDELHTAEEAGQLDGQERAMLKHWRQEYDRSSKIPPDRYQAYVTLTSQAESVWETCKEEADFATFQPYLEKIVEMTREFIGYWGYEDHPYNALLEPYEPGMTVEVLDGVFSKLRERLVPLVAAIADSSYQPKSDFLNQPFDEANQRRFSELILREMGYDFEAGRLDRSVHPFATGLNPGDVRITTDFRPRDLTFSLFSSIHEGGHALYEQNIDPALLGTGLCTGTSMGIHESQSRFWENMIGRSLPFWKRYFRDLSAQFPDAFDGIDVNQFYESINEVKPSLIRIEADELTYNLHIIIRYELEKLLFSGQLEVRDLPEAWNARYKSYLGVEPQHDGEGVLQDVHWSGGAFGYFPSYSLGNMYAAQFSRVMERDIPDLDERVATGDLQPLKQWLTDHIYRYGKSQTPGEIVQRVTGEPLNPDYLADYFERKFKALYRL